MNGMTATRYDRDTRFLWTWLTIFTLASVVGNVVHAAIITDAVMRWVGVGIAVLIPVGLLFATHAIPVQARRGGGRTAYWFAVSATVCIVGMTFAASFFALRDLAEMASVSPRISWIIPAFIDLSLATAAVSLTTGDDKPVKRAPKPRTTTPANRANPRPETARSAPASTARNADSARETADQNRANRGRDVRESRDSAPATDARSAETAPATDARFAETADPELARIADMIVENRVTRKPRADVLAVLLAHREGAALNRIAADTRVHRDAVAKIIAAAADDLDQPQLTVVG